MTNYIIETHQLTKAYNKHLALDQVSIQVEKGKIYGLIGRNGAGKTTLLKILSQQIKASSGNYTIQDRPAKDLAYYSMGMMIESPGLYPYLTAYDNIRLKCEAMGIRRKNYIEGLIDLVGLAAHQSKKARNYSLGMKQRLSLALALVGDPDILLLDEPTNGLDPQGIAEFRALIQQLNQERGISIIISSHILSELSRLIDKVGILHEGCLIKEATKSELDQENQDKLVLTSSQLDQVLACLEEQIHLTDYLVVNDTTLHIFQYLDQQTLIPHTLIKAGILFDSYSFHENSLEDYYLQLTGGGHHA